MIHASELSHERGGISVVPGQIRSVRPRTLTSRCLTALYAARFRHHLTALYGSTSQVDVSHHHSRPSSMAVTTVTFSYRPFRADLASSLRPRAMFGCIRLLAEDRSRTYQALAQRVLFSKICFQVHNSAHTRGATKERPACGNYDTILGKK